MSPVSRVLRWKDSGGGEVVEAAHYDALLALNQRLREERAQVRAIALDENVSHIDRLLRIEKLTREALAGDAE